MTQVLVNTEDPELYSLLKYILEAEGFSATFVADRDDVGKVSYAQKAVVILDANCGTLKLCRSIRDRLHPSPAAIIGLVRPGESPSHLELLRYGTMECLTRPFNLSALLGLIRKASGTEDNRPAPKSHTVDVMLDPRDRSVTWRGQTARLSPIEFAMFSDLHAHHGNVRMRSDLRAAARSATCSLTDRGVDVHLCRLRRSLGHLGSHWIETIRRGGYRLRVPTD